LRLATAGSVDDGKSTLIGRLLYDTKSILQDQLDQVAEASKRRGGDGALDLSLLTDGLRAEREQGITIDVAYRYFATPKRSFILADTPGHVQYTRNMVTGASTADAAIVLIDARNGWSSRPSAMPSSPRDSGSRISWSRSTRWTSSASTRRSSTRSCATSARFASGLNGVRDVAFIPLSAKDGDNVVDRSERMPCMADWRCSSISRRIDRRWRPRPRQPALPGAVGDSGGRDSHHDYRGYAGQVAGGVVRPGDAVVVLPSGVQTTVEAVETTDGPLEEAFPPMSVTIRLSDDVDVSRGDLISPPHDRPELGREFPADLCWMADRPLRAGGRYAIKHATFAAQAVVDEIIDRVDVHTLEREAARSSWL